mmetsp:Transcript_2204/g.3316  ORF Transcript_2204/g.3316 Transcript_2204/m.3316 type:complete len:106 (+) Transcript_2204:135-452(+)
MKELKMRYNKYKLRTFVGEEMKFLPTQAQEMEFELTDEVVRRKKEIDKRNMQKAEAMDLMQSNLGGAFMSQLLKMKKSGAIVVKTQDDEQEAKLQEQKRKDEENF